jgi:uncharacterized peroxidase-related enzyme
MHVHTIAPEDATGLVRELYDADLAGDGYVSNISRLYSLRPDVLVAWRNLGRTIREPMDLRRYELATLAAASALRCRYCVAAHGEVLESKFYDRDQLEAIVRDYRGADCLDARDVAIMAFAEKVALHAYRVTADDVDELRGHGLTDTEIFEVALAAAARSFFSKSLDAMGAEPDEALGPTIGLLDLVEPRPGGS